LNKYNKITLLTIFIILLCVSLGSVSAAGTENTGPTVTANLTSGTYNTTQTVALTANDSSATIYYSNDTTDPRNSTTRTAYTGSPITINSTTTLRYAAVDTAGNWSPLYLQNYIIGNVTVSNNNGQSNYTGPQTNTPNWTYKVGGSGTDSSVTIGPDGTIYVGTMDISTYYGYLYAFNPNGTLKWAYNTAGYPIIGPDGTLYVGGGSSGIFYALTDNGNKATVKWSYEAGFNRYIKGYNIGADGTIYVGIANTNQLIAFNPNGTIKWTYKINWPTSPVIGSDGTIYVGESNGGQNLYAINPDGTLKWTYRPNTTYGYLSKAPVIGSDGTLYFSDTDAHFYALNPDGTLKWYLSNEGNPTIGADGTIYLEGWGTIYALTSNGAVKWTYSAPCTGDSSITIGADGTLYFGAINSLQTYGIDSPGVTDLYALNPNGTLKWTYHVGGVISGLTIGPDGTLYVGGRATGNIYAFKDPIPVANFKTNTTNGTGSLTVQFTDNSTGIPISWNWNFGDGTTSNLQNPTHTYTKPGTYTVTLTVTGPGGSNKIIKTSYITVNTPDTTKPTASVNTKGGLYNTNKTIKLSMSENGTIYYTLNGSTPTSSSKKYTGAITITSTTTLKYIAVDATGNKSPVYTVKYTIDKTAPKVSAISPKSGVTGVSRTSTISIKLSENVLKSVNWSKVYIKNLKTGAKCKATIWISGNHIYIKTSKKAALTWYQVYIPASAIKDNAGNNLAASYTWKFKTGKT